MEQFEFTFENKNGLHARPAGELVNKVKQYSSVVTLEVPSLNKSASADKLFTLMGLGVQKGETVVVKLEGENAAQEKEELRSFLAEKFSENQ